MTQRFRAWHAAPAVGLALALASSGWANVPGCLEEAGGFPFGAAYLVAVEGDHAYVGSGTWLMVVDITDPASPTRVGAIELPDFPMGIAASGGLAFVANGDAGLRVIDVSTPSSPVEVGGLPGAAFLGVAAVASYAYVGTSTELLVVDVSNPASPAQVGACTLPSPTHRMAAQGTTAYVTAGEAGLRIIDVSNSTSPVELGSWNDPQWGVRGVSASGSFAYVTLNPSLFNPEQPFGRMTVIDVSIPSSPIEVGWQNMWDPGEIVALGSVACVGARWDLHIVDVSTPSSPDVVGRLPVLGSADEVAVSASLAVVMDSDLGLKVVDVSVPASPGVLGAWHISHSCDLNWAVDVAVQASHAFLVDACVIYPEGASSLRVIDLSTPSTPVEIGNCWTDPAYSVALQGSYAYVTTGYRFTVVDISSPPDPNPVGLLVTGPAYDVAVEGDYAYVVTRDYGLWVVDVSIPASPTRVGSWTVATRPGRVAVAGSHAFVTDWDSGLWVVDVSIPSDPVEVGLWGWPGSATRLAVDGNLLYVAESGWGERVLDVSNPLAPVQVGYAGIGHAANFAISGSFAFLADGYRGMLVLENSSCPDVLFADGFESANTWAWSAAVE